MKVLHFDCYAGISGDMALGALVDLGVDPERLRSELAKLGLSGWKLNFVEDERGGLRGLHAAVELEGETGHIARDDDDDNGGHHHHEHHNYDNHNHHKHDHNTAGHRHRSWRGIRALIEESALGTGAKKRALAIFTRIAEAEAEVHGVAPEDVTFHEVGALDSIIDVVGTAVCLDILNPDRITAGPVELGGGTVRCAHGILPVPAPAVLVLLRGIPVTTGGFDKEMTTPTGAAIIAASADDFIVRDSFTQIKTGVGVGTRITERPNLLRVSLRESPPLFPSDANVISEELVLMETNIDDMTAEALGFLMERLFAAGALDVTIAPCVMKKSRPGSVVSALCPPTKLAAIRDAMFRNSSTIGFREIAAHRISLKRETEEPDGSGARTKKVYYGGKLLRSKVEYEDRAALARDRNISLSEAERLIEKGPRQ
jgi:uncharacterized protein (TIGR00299 family) protein